MTDTEKAEQARRKGIRDACMAVRLPKASADALIAKNVPLADALRRIFAAPDKRDRLARRFSLDFIERADALLMELRTGQINIHVHQGQVVTDEIKERLRGSDRKPSTSTAEQSAVE